MKHFLVGMLGIAGLLMPGVVLARTNCDDKPKPAFSCPTGYSLMCNPTGGDHWSCGKESRDGLIEWSPDPEPVPSLMEESKVVEQATTGVKQTIQTQVRTAPTPGECDDRDEDCDRTINPVDDDDDGDLVTDFEERISGDPDFDLLRISDDGDVSLTVTNGGRDRLRAAIDAGDATVRGWDPGKKEVIVGPAQVDTPERLADYSVALSLADDRIRAMDSDAQGGATVRYRSEGTLLWVKRVRYDITATVQRPAEGETYGRVKVRFPWFSFLVRSSVHAAEIESEASSDLAAHELAHVIQQRAQMFSTLSNILKSKHDAAMSAIQNIR